MADPDSYLAIEKEGSAERKVRGSRFLGLALAVVSTRESEERVRALQKKYHDATHVCFAWRVGHGKGVAFRSSDAGEPSGTAGAPILAAMESGGVSDGLIAVVRWFGGTKLGTGRLARAYGECARLALEGATLAVRVLRAPLVVTFPYAYTGQVLRQADRFGALTEETCYGDERMIRFAVPASRLEAFREAIAHATAGAAGISAPHPGPEQVLPEDPLTKPGTRSEGPILPPRNDK